jgi:outer membrane murein-binding lipoprotein Lpp
VPSGATTPRIAMILGGMIVVASLAAGTVTYAKLDQLRSTVKVVAHDTEPSVVAALRIRSDIEIMNADAANDLMSDNGRKVGTSADYTGAARTLRQDLESASENITYGDAERLPIEDVYRFGVTQYEGALGEIRGSALVHPPRFIASRFQWATRLLEDFATPAAERLKDANLVPLERQYNDFVANTRLATFETFAALGGALAMVVIAQIFAARRLGHRMLSPLGLAAMAILVVAMVGVPWQVNSARRAVIDGKTNAFDSVLYLQKAKTILERMNAAESLWLVVQDPVVRADLERKFHDDARAVLDFPAGATPTWAGLPGEIVQSTRLECDGNAAAATEALPKLAGLFGDELGNVTYGCDERMPASAAVAAFIDYVDIDARIRALENAGDHLGAITLCIGTKPGQSDEAFGRLEKAVDDTIAVNQGWFDREFGHSERNVAMMTWIVGLAIGFATLFGVGDLWVRTRHYR